MSEYRVYWTIDVDADSPEEAARKALRTQRDPSSIATNFEVVKRCECGGFHEEIDGKTIDFHAPGATGTRQ